MALEETYTSARDNLAKLLDRVEQDRDVVWIRRRGHEDVALVAGSELRSLLETAHLLRSPKNATRLLGALRRALGSKGRKVTTARLRKSLSVTSGRTSGAAD